MVDISLIPFVYIGASFQVKVQVKETWGSIGVQEHKETSGLIFKLEEKGSFLEAA